MGRSQRRKGAEGELEVAHIFKAAGFDVDRVPNSGGLKVKGDLKGNAGETRLDGYHLETKRQETIELPAWLRQAHEEAEPGQVPVVVLRKAKTKANGPVGEWHACLPLPALVELLRRAA
jgi:hypothetical protein